MSSKLKGCFEAGVQMELHKHLEMLNKELALIIKLKEGVQSVENDMYILAATLKASEAQKELQAWADSLKTVQKLMETKK